MTTMAMIYFAWQQNKSLSPERMHIFFYTHMSSIQEKAVIIYLYMSVSQADTLFIIDLSLIIGVRYRRYPNSRRVLSYG